MTTTSKKHAPAGPTSPPVENPTASSDAPVDPSTLAGIRGHWPALKDVQRKAYLSQFTDAECEKLGTKTRGELVRNEAGGWVVSIDDQLRSSLAADIPYSPGRLVYLLDLIEKLDGELAKQAASQGRVADVKNAAADKEVAAETVAEKLYAALERVAGKRKTEVDALGKADIAVKTPEDIVKRAAERAYRRTRGSRLSA